MFGLFNSALDHQARKQTLSRLPQTISDFVRLARCYLTDDNDAQIYLAYCNAILQRAYPPALVRPWEGWAATDFALPVEGAEEWPTRPGREGLLPYRDFVVEYPPGFFLLAVPPALLSADLDAYRTLFSCLMGLCLSLAVRHCQADLKAQQQDWSLAMVVALGLPARQALVGRPGPGSGGSHQAVAVVDSAGVGPIFAQAGGGELVRLVGLAAVTMGVLCLPVADWLGSLWAYHSQRPLQLESTAAALLGLSTGDWSCKRLAPLDWWACWPPAPGWPPP